MRPLYMASKFGKVDVRHWTTWKNVSEINHSIDTCMTPLYMASKNPSAAFIIPDLGPGTLLYY